MTSSLAMPATGETRNPRGVSPQPSIVVRPTDSRRCHSSGTLSDLHPVELDVLAIGDVGGAAGEVFGDRAQYSQLLAAQAPAVQTYPLHEVAVGQLGDVQLGGATPVNALLALGVQTHQRKRPLRSSGAMVS